MPNVRRTLICKTALINFISKGCPNFSRPRGIITMRRLGHFTVAFLGLFNFPCAQGQLSVDPQFQTNLSHNAACQSILSSCPGGLSSPSKYQVHLLSRQTLLTSKRSAILGRCCHDHLLQSTNLFYRGHILELRTIML